MSTYIEPLSFVKQSVSSILHQTHRNLELLIAVDDPSNTAVIHYLKSESKKDKRLSFFINAHNLGLPACQTKLLSKAKGNYIAHMDADDIAKPERLEKELRRLIKDHLDLVGANVIDIDVLSQLLGTKTNYPAQDKYIKKYLYYGNCLPSSTWLFKKELFNQLGGYINFPVCEDYDFVLRGALNGFRYGLIREPLVYYRYNPQGASKRKEHLLNLTTYYIQQKYRVGQTFQLKEFNSFSNSTKGKAINQALIEYNSLLNSPKSVHWIDNLFIKIFKSKVFREQLFYKAMRKLIKKA